MGIKLVTFYNSTVTPQDDALIYENALPASGMIFGGNVTIKNANTLHISAGHGALCGRKFTIEEDDIPIILTSSGTLNGRLYIHMDLSDTGEPISLEVERANVLTPVVQQSNVNINDGIYEINLATFTISTSTVSDLNYVAPFIRDLDAREVIIAPVEPTNIASSNYAIGRRLILNKVLYRVTATITAGQTITPGTNVTESNSVEEQIEANLSSINTINNNKLNQSVIATRQSNLIASKDYVIGEQFVYNNILYRATAAIAKNATITIGGNATTADSISTQISNLANQLNFSITSMNLSRSTLPAGQGVSIGTLPAGGVYLVSVNLRLQSGTFGNGVIISPCDGIVQNNHDYGQHFCVASGGSSIIVYNYSSSQLTLHSGSSIKYVKIK